MPMPSFRRRAKADASGVNEHYRRKIGDISGTMDFERSGQAINQMAHINRFVEEVDRSGLHRCAAQRFPVMRTHENDGHPVTVGEQAAVQIESGHARHLHIGNHAGGIGNVTATEQVLG